MNETLDFTTLTQTVSSSEIRVYARKYKAYDYILWLVLVILTLLSIWGLLVVLVTDLRQATPILIWVGILGIAGVCSRWFYIRSLKKRIRMQRFAEQNNFLYYDRTKPEEQGDVFRRGRDQKALEVVSGSWQGHPFWFGNFYYTVGSGKRTRTIRVGVLNITLPRAVPYVVLDGRQNTMDIAGSIDTSQKLELEGDFNTHFTVYCPKDYERDVLYFLTPELMQALVDMDDMFDAEVVGKELYFYTKKEIKPDETLLRNLFKIIPTIGGEIVENTKRYQDWRIDKKLASVAPAGLTLKKSIWPTIVGAILIIMYLLLELLIKI